MPFREEPRRQRSKTASGIFTPRGSAAGEGGAEEEKKEL